MIPSIPIRIEIRIIDTIATVDALVDCGYDVVNRGDILYDSQVTAINLRNATSVIVIYQAEVPDNLLGLAFK